MPQDLAATAAAALAGPAHKAIARYPRHLRRALRALARDHDRCDDLLVSFPAACVALATRRGAAHDRGEALWRVREGRPLREVAQALDLPLWLRNLPPEAFLAPIPERLAHEGEDPWLGAQLAARAPKDAVFASAWTRRTFQAIEEGSEAFAVWVCDRVPRADPRLASVPRALCAHAFFSEAPDTPAGALVVEPWTPKSGWRSALRAARGWLLRAVFEEAFDHDAIHDIATKQSVFDGARIVPLYDPRALKAEGEAMRHCIASYWVKVAAGLSLLFRIEDEAGVSADFEVCRGREGDLNICEMRAADNHRPARRLRALAQRWVRAKLEPLGAAAFPFRLAVREEAWARLFEPYWRARPARIGVPRRPAHHDLWELIAEIEGA